MSQQARCGLTQGRMGEDGGLWFMETDHQVMAGERKQNMCLWTGALGLSEGQTKSSD